MLENMQKLNRNQKFLVLSLIPFYFLIIAFIYDSPATILLGLYNIFQEPDLLITDYMVIGGIGATFVNASLLTLVSIFIVYMLDMEMDGHTITAACLMFGFSLFGKNIINIWSILLGVWCYAVYHKTSLSKVIYIGLYGTSLSPIITQILQITTLPPILKIVLSLAVGIFIGFILPPLSSHLYSMHRGFSLYNVGFSAGIISTIIASLFKSFGIETSTRLIWSTGNNVSLFIALAVLFGLMIVSGFLFDRQGVIGYLKILISSGVNAPDYLKRVGMRSTFMNMGVNGLVATLVVVLVGGDLNGPTLGGIFAIVGFSSTGKHILNITPIMLGVYLASLVKVWNISDPSPLLTCLMATTLAPIAGRYGFVAGIIAGFIHSSVALNIVSVYDGMNLYNNGFAGGIVASFLVPIITSFRDRKNRVKRGI